MYFDLLGFNLFDPFLDPPLSLSELSRVVHIFIDIIDSVFTWIEHFNLVACAQLKL